jgi:hypothetical protein
MFRSYTEDRTVPSPARAGLVIYPETVALGAILASSHQPDHKPWISEHLRQLGLRTPPPDTTNRG